MTPTRHVLLDPAHPLEALTATARGLIEYNFAAPSGPTPS